MRTVVDWLLLMLLMMLMKLLMMMMIMAAYQAQNGPIWFQSFSRRRCYYLLCYLLRI